MRLVLSLVVALGLVLTAQAQCAGNTVITDTTGSFNDGTAAGADYGTGLDCSWTFTPSLPNATFVTISFSRFDVPYTGDYPAGSWVSIYDGTSDSDPLLIQYTGSIVPEEAIGSSSPSLFIKFETDAGTVGTGWSIDFNVASTPPPPGSCFEATYTAPSGTITDGSGAGQYTEFLDCYRFIEPASPSITYVTLTWTEFDVNVGDYVEVFDGDHNDQLLARYNGGDPLPGPISSTRPTMAVRFVTGSGSFGNGWSLNYVSETGTPPNYRCAPTNTLDTVTGNIVDNNVPHQGGFYYPNTTCTWLIQPTVTGAEQWIQWTFASYNVADFDVITFYDGINDQAPLINQFGGGSVPPAVISTTGLSLYVTWVTNVAVEDFGWEANYAAQTGTPPDNHCPTNSLIESASGSVIDGPGDYTNNINCEWVVSPAGADYVSFDVTSVNMTANDYIQIYDGSSTTAHLLSEITGPTTTPPAGTFFSSGSSITIVFVTDVGGVASGWQIDFQGETGTPPASAGHCVDTLLTGAANGTIADGSMSGPHQNNLDCSFTIDVTFDSQYNYITLDFTEFHLEDGFDFVTVYDGSDETANVLGVFTGTDLPYVQSSGPVMHVRFQTSDDTAAPASGWSADWNGETGIAPVLQCPFQTVLNASGIAIAFEDGSGAGDYADNVQCQWLINPSDAGVEFVHVDITAFDVDITDQVTFYDGSTTSSPVIVSLSGNAVAPLTVSSSGHTMLIRFQAVSGTATGAGWDMEYTTFDFDCSGVAGNADCTNANTQCTADDTCTCVPGYSGMDCLTAQCPTVTCGSQASCTEFDICTCDAGYSGDPYGAGCPTPVCDPECAANADCTGPDTCTCQSGWSGDPDVAGCLTATCDGVGNCPNTNTRCISPDVCGCDAGWSGNPDSPAGCNVTVCAGGLCASTTAFCSPTMPGVCECVAGYSNPPACDTPVCSSPCGANSYCFAPDQCVCEMGWQEGATPNVCDAPTCTPACGADSFCSAPDTCECLKGFGGPSCDRLGTDVVFVHVALDFAEYDVNVMVAALAGAFTPEIHTYQVDIISATAIDRDTEVELRFLDSTQEGAGEMDGDEILAALIDMVEMGGASVSVDGGFRVIAVYDGTQELLAENPDVPPTPEAVTDGGGGLIIGLAIAGAVVFFIILGAGLCWWRHRLFSRGMELKDAQRRSTSGGETPMEDVGAVDMEDVDIDDLPEAEGEKRY